MSESNSMSGKGLFPPKYAFTLMFPGRKFILSPARLIEQMKPEKESFILEIGPGPGYFSVDVARAVPEGRLVLFDIQQEMLDKAEKRLEKNEIRNVDLVKSDGKTFPFPDRHFDIIFMVTVLGEVEEKETYIREFRRILKEDGRIIVAEQKGDPDLISEEDLEMMLSKEGFRIAERFGNRLYYSLVFQR